MAALFPGLLPLIPKWTSTAPCWSGSAVPQACEAGQRSATVPAGGCLLSTAAGALDSYYYSTCNMGKIWHNSHMIDIITWYLGGGVCSVAEVSVPVIKNSPVQAQPHLSGLSAKPLTPHCGAPPFSPVWSARRAKENHC